MVSTTRLSDSRPTARGAPAVPRITLSRRNLIEGLHRHVSAIAP